MKGASISGHSTWTEAMEFADKWARRGVYRYAVRGLRRRDSILWVVYRVERQR